MREIPGFLKWLYPGMKIKRWIALIFLGVFLVSLGTAATAFYFFTTPDLEAQIARRLLGLAVGGFILGAVTLTIGIYRLLRSIGALAKRAGPTQDLVDVAYERRYLGRGPRITVLGGGTGMSNLLSGLKEHTSEITAIVTVADDGGSSGRLRKEFDMLPPGDVRKCLSSLSDERSLLGEVLRYRFNESELEGHSFGNLLLTVLARITGDFGEAVREASRILAVRGRVIPATLERINLVAPHPDGSKTTGQALITRSERPIERIELKPTPHPAASDIVRAIEEAQVIVIGPGSLYTSVLPNLLIDGIHQALARSHALRIYVASLVSCENETGDYTLKNYLDAIRAHVSERIFDAVLVNSGPLSRAGGPGGTGALPVRYDPREFWNGVAQEEDLKSVEAGKAGEASGTGRVGTGTGRRSLRHYADVHFVQADVGSREDPTRHDSQRLAREILSMYERFARET